MSDIYQNLPYSRWNCKDHVVCVPKAQSQLADDLGHAGHVSPRLLTLYWGPGCILTASTVLISTVLIQKVSGAILILIGLYLGYYFFTAGM